MGRKDVIEGMRDILIKRRDALRQAIAGDDSMLREMNQQSGGDVVDFAMDSAHGELSSQLAEVESRQLRSIENALERMKAGTYGKCEACNKSIPLARLEALPFATYCINCKRLAEEAGVEPGMDVDWSKILETSDDVSRFNDFKIS